MAWRKAASGVAVRKCKKWRDFKLKVLETDKINLLWDFNIQCDHVVEAGRADIIVVEKEDRV